MAARVSRNGEAQLRPAGDRAGSAADGNRRPAGADGAGDGATVPSTLLSRPARLGQLVVAALIEQIVSGRFPEGASLPPEPVLCQDFNVSRSVIRESVKLLEEKGLVVARQGQGTTVLPIDQWGLLDPLVLDAFIRNDRKLGVYDELIEVRAGLESQMARHAATRLTAAELDHLQGHIDGLEALLDDPPGYAAADLSYHDAIGRFSGQVLPRSILRTVQPIALSNSYYGATHRTRQDNVRSHRGHVAIFERLRARDAEGAAQAVATHILGSWDVYKRSLRRSRRQA
jgi:DNA-binding FadR family transcriptional regulator